MKANSLTALSNMKAGKNAWMVVTGVLVIVCLALLYGITFLSTHQVVRLVPYGFDTAQGIVEISANGKDNLEYISHIAMADVKLVTDWTPKNVKVQFNRFVNRLAPEYRHTQITNLIARAEKLSKSADSQVFFPDNPKAKNGKNVIIGGIINRWVGEEKMVDESITYDIQYRYIDAIPYIVKFDITMRENNDDNEKIVGDGDGA